MKAARPEAQPKDALYRWAVLSRVLAATLGGYGVSALAMALLALLLSSGPDRQSANSVLFATMLSFVLYPVIVIVVFSVRSALRAWLGLGVIALLLGAAIAVFSVVGA